MTVTRIGLFVFFTLLIFSVYAQDTATLLLSRQLIEDNIYQQDSLMHTTWKPLLYEAGRVKPADDDTWLKRKFFQEHLLNVQQPGYSIYGDIIVDEYIGYDKREVSVTRDNKTATNHLPMMNTRGYEVSGSIGTKFYFETNFYENQGRFGGYADSFIRQYKVIPRQARFKNKGDGLGFDFNYANARLMYLPNKHLLLDVGYSRNFIGDGYRSVLLSDYATDYPYLRASLQFGRFQYSAMWSQYLADVNRPSELYAYGYVRKWAQTYLLDWQATNTFTVSLFESVIWSGENSKQRSDLTASYASPVIFLHGNKSKSGLNNNELIGLNLKYTFLPETFVYAQFAADQLESNANKRYAAQLGVRSTDIGNIHNWNGLVEFNTARPYTYSSDNLQTTYTHSLLPLAHPLGANFTEVIAVTDYTYKNWWFRLEGFVAKYGNDSANQSSNYGRDILNTGKNYPDGSITTGQGISTKLYFADLRIAYLLNKQTNLRIEANVTYRRETNAFKKYEDIIAAVGIRMSFRNLLYDF